MQHAWEVCMKHDLTAVERCVMLAIANHINATTNQWRMGIHIIAAEAGVNPSYCKRVITSLRRKGVLASHQSLGDRACTWWFPMLSGSALDAPLVARETRLDQREASATDSAPDAQSPSAPDATNTQDTQIEEIPGEIQTNPDGLSSIELQLIAAKIDRGISKAEAVRDVLAMRARRGGSREHGTSTGRAPKTRPLQAIGQILGETS
jgi:DNA-binding MarR family transcriptional regulator